MISSSSVRLGATAIRKVYKGSSLLFSDAVTTYYVSSTGSDANDGSVSNPFQTIAKVNALTLLAGDSVLFKAGESFGGELHLKPQHSGTALNPVIIGSYGVGRATILPSINQKGIYIHNCGGIEVSDLIITGVGSTTSTQNGVKVYMDDTLTGNLSHIYLDNLKVSGFKGRGISISTWNYSTEYTLLGGSASTARSFDDVRITNCEAHDNGLAGIYSEGNYPAKNHTNLYVGHCKVYNNTGVVGASGSEASNGSGILMSGFDTGVIEYCETYNNGVSGIAGIGLMVWACKSITIQFCSSYENKSANNLDGGGINIDGEAEGCTIQYCYTYNNYGAGLSLYQYPTAIGNFTNNTIRYCISVNDGRKNSYGAISTWNGGSTPSTGTHRIYNNTVYLDASGIVSGVPSGLELRGLANVQVRNNIIVASGAGVALFDGTLGTEILSNNIYYAASGATSNLSAGGTIVNPLLVNPTFGAVLPANLATALVGYKVQNTSPAIGAGIQADTNMGGRDFFNTATPIDTTYDIGAAEVQAAPAVATSPSADGMFTWHKDDMAVNGSSQLLQWNDVVGANDFIDSYHSGDRFTVNPTGINGIKTLEGASGGATGSSISTDYFTGSAALNNYSLFIVFKAYFISADAIYFEFGTDMLRIRSSATSGTLEVFHDVGAKLSIASSLEPNITFLLNVTYGSDQVLRVYKNGVLIGSKTGVTSKANDYIALGSRIQTPELLTYNKVLSTMERAQTTEYLLNKYAIS